MAVFRDQPYGNARFVVQIDGLASTAFAEAHPPELGGEVVEYQDGNDPEGESHKIPGRPRFGPLRLRRGFRGDLELYAWWRQATGGDPAGRRMVRGQLLDEGATGVVAEWVLHGAWPVRYAVNPLLAQGGEILMEEVEVVCDGVELR